MIRLMEVCGTHTMAVARSGIRKLLPESVRLISGPGCPVCVTAQADIDRAIGIAKLRGVIMTTFGDMMRVPGIDTSLTGVRERGADVRVVYSPLDALAIARGNPAKKVVFMGIGFETTSPAVAATILEAKREGLRNLFLLSNFKLIPPALEKIARSKKLNIDGFICPGHVSVITGTAPYENFVKRYKRPCVITGFEDIDILKGIKKLVEQIKGGAPRVEIEYKRAVKKQGNLKARRILYSVFEARDCEWRGLGLIKDSGLKLRAEYNSFDAEKEFKVGMRRKKTHTKGCLCGEVIQGIKSPPDCRLFRKICTPDKPVGPCMVSSEGTCAAYYRYGR